MALRCLQLTEYFIYYLGAEPFVRVKSKAPYTEEEAEAVYLNPLARAGFDKQANTWTHAAGCVATPLVDVSVSEALVEATASAAGATGKGVGIDVQLISEVNNSNETFIARNFTEAERRYCDSQPDPQCSYAGRWAAKEAVIKAVTSAAGRQVFNGGAGASLIDIEVVRVAGHAPVVELHNEAKTLVEQVGIKQIKATISHSGSYAGV